MLLTIDTHRTINRVLAVALNCELRVWLDGQDVTHRCFVADDKEGYVGVYLLDDHGRHVRRDNGHAAVEVLAGQVQYVITATGTNRRVQAVMTADERGARP